MLKDFKFIIIMSMCSKNIQAKAELSKTKIKR